MVNSRLYTRFLRCIYFDITVYNRYLIYTYTDTYTDTLLLTLKT
nr:MAG TPA: hypothetical protein [Caudoviricetes sp.]DAT80786.1 MAG TPA: hypothetical protein [Caudoviricetes sp.]